MKKEYSPVHNYAGKILNSFLYSIFAFFLGITLPARGQQKYFFEKLGEPLHAEDVTVSMVTKGVRPMAWVSVESPDLYDVVGIEIESGKSFKLGLEKYGRTHIKTHLATNGNLYVYYGKPAHFLKYDATNGKVIDLGQVSENGSYALRPGVGPDGKFWVGSYPDTELSWVDPSSDKIGSYKRISDDIKEKYIMEVKISDDNIVYSSVGLHHPELWALNPVTGNKKQILPQELMQKQGFPWIYLGNDGKIYGEYEGRKWRCRPDGIEFVDKIPAQRRQDYKTTYNGERFTSINEKAELIAQKINGSSKRLISSDFALPAKMIYNLGPIVNGKLYGGGASGRATIFSYDLKTGKLVDHGVQGAGTVQIYDLINHARGIFFTTYTLGGIDLYDPVSEKVTAIDQLHEKYQQERLMQLILGPDGNIYTGTMPVKGILGGALVKINPNDLSVKVFRNIIPEQSIISVVPVPANNEIFFTSNIRGGSSSIPTQKEAVVGFWDIKAEKVIWQVKPIPGSTEYGQAALGSDGLIYGLTEKQFYVIDPKKRKVIRTGDLPVKALRHYAFHGAAAGPKGMIYGLGDDAIFAIDPKTKEVAILSRHESINKAQGVHVTEDGTIYYGSGAGLWRATPAK